MIYFRIGDRAHVYGWFDRYRQYMQNNSLFDSCDFVRHLYIRMIRLNSDPTRRFRDFIIHQIFVDETQDFTQAELALIIQSCAWANRMFFTGTVLFTKP